MITTKQRVFRLQYFPHLCSVLELLHPASHGDLDHLEAWDVDLLNEAQDARQDVRVLKQSWLRVIPLYSLLYCIHSSIDSLILDGRSIL